MAIFTYGSINIDHIYTLPHLPAPGETLTSSSYRAGLGGKGANQSVAAARAGARVTHLGAVGPDGQWAVDRLSALGVGTGAIIRPEVPTGHAIIFVDAQAENQIVLFPGANHQLSLKAVRSALEGAQPGDTLLIQNEVTGTPEVAEYAYRRGLRVMTSAAPFDPDALRAVLPFTTSLALNAVEAAQLQATLGALTDIPELLVTRGAAGAELIAGGKTLHQPAITVVPADTTGAGDTFAGYYAAARDEGQSPAAALRLAAAAAALKVTRPGTADAIPARTEVDSFFEGRA